jgi:hypothetical protein
MIPSTYVTTNHDTDFRFRFHISVTDLQSEAVNRLVQCSGLFLTVASSYSYPQSKVALQDWKPPFPG